MARNPSDEKQDSFLGVASVIFAGIFMLGLLTWLVASHRIVFASLRPALFFGSMWTWVPSDWATMNWNSIARNVTAFARNPAKVDVVSWVHIMNLALRPVMIIAMTVFACMVIFMRLRPKAFVRRFTPKLLMGEQVKNFTGIAPVVAIRKQIAQDKHPLWRRQVSPDEIFLNYRVPNGKALTTAPAGAPMIQDGKFNREVAKAYFTDVRGMTKDARMVSGMIGRQIVNLPVDAGRQNSVVFADRFSNEGKALLALWTSVAFGGEAGRDEFCKYRDALNRSAYGTADGKANLSLVQDLYNKNRKHPGLNKIFALHHWEHTALFALLGLAQKKGRFTTAEVLWLRPTNRVMFFALNTRGSYTPHTEAAATFTQYAFEQVCAKNQRLPVVRQENGNLVHTIYVEKAVDGLELEMTRWFEAFDDGDDDWWLHKDLWQSTEAVVNHAFKQIAAHVPVANMPGTEGDGATDFDKQESAKMAASMKEEEERLKRAIGAVNSGNSELDAFMS